MTSNRNNIRATREDIEMLRRAYAHGQSCEDEDFDDARHGHGVESAWRAATDAGILPAGMNYETFESWLCDIGM